MFVAADGGALLVDAGGGVEEGGPPPSMDGNVKDSPDKRRLLQGDDMGVTVQCQSPKQELQVVVLNVSECNICIQYFQMRILIYL